MVVPRAKKHARKNSLSSWARIKRPEAKRKPIRAKVASDASELYKRMDLKGSWFIFGWSLKEVELGLDVGISAITKKGVRGLKKGEKYSVLDAGCGPGSALGDLKKSFGNRVRTVGLALKKTPGESYCGVDRLIEGRLTKVEPREKFNLIYSYSGAHFFEELNLTAVEKTINWLKPGGIAVINIDISNRGIPVSEVSQIKKEIKTVLKANGIKRWELKKDKVLIFKKPKRKIPN